MNQPSKHLTDEAFADLLAHAGCSSHEPASSQQPEVLVMHSALQSYRAETLQWAERRSSTRASLLPAARRSDRWAALPQWSLALVAAVTIAAGVAHVAETRAVVQDTAAVTVPSVEARALPADIAADNRLLSSIDAALSYHADSPVDALQLKSEHRGSDAIESPGVTD